jgi:hypothetical protein
MSPVLKDFYKMQRDEEISAMCYSCAKYVFINYGWSFAAGERERMEAKFGPVPEPELDDDEVKAVADIAMSEMMGYLNPPDYSHTFDDDLSDASQEQVAKTFDTFLEFIGREAWSLEEDDIEEKESFDMISFIGDYLFKNDGVTQDRSTVNMPDKTKR